MEQPRAVIIGGGLAGMTVARVLAARGLRVVIVEGGPRLGGKAGAREVDGRWEDHGYHVFPAWYVNTRRLLRDLGCAGNLIDIEQFFYLRRGDFPRFVTVHQFSSIANLVRNFRSGLLPWPQTFLSYYYILDLSSQSFDSRSYLDRVTATGFMRSRFYATEGIANFHQQSVLQASAIQYYELSAMTLQKICKAWMKHPAPALSILNGNLQEKFILPYQRRLEGDFGVEVQLGREVKRIALANGRVATLWLDDGTAIDAGGPADVFVLAVPPARALELVDSAIFDAENVVFQAQIDRRGLADIANLRSAPMAALHVHFKRRIPHIPREHVNFVESRFGLSFIDISQHWEGLENTELNCIASYFEPLSALSQEDMTRYLLAELLDYLPGVSQADVAATYLQPHLKEPLFLNTVGAWHFRPATRTAIPNLFIAGDYCRSDADLTTMESAVFSALTTGADILAQLGLQPDWVAEAIAMPARAPLLLGKYALLPIAALVALWAKRAELRRGGTQGAGA